jgi:nucleotide-binding universal stress UspA family protein
VIDATIHLLHVFTLQDKRERALMSHNTYAYLKTAEQSQLQAARSRCRARGRRGSVLWHEGDPATQILLAAAALQADLIMMGACARRLLQRVRLGSVAEAVIRKAPCTVMVVRDKAAGAQAN